MQATTTPLKVRLPRKGSVWRNRTTGNELRVERVSKNMGYAVVIAIYIKSNRVRRFTPGSFTKRYEPVPT